VCSKIIGEDGDDRDVSSSTSLSLGSVLGDPGGDEADPEEDDSNSPVVRPTTLEMRFALHPRLGWITLG